jgi:hypothetical protein
VRRNTKFYDVINQECDEHNQIDNNEKYIVGIWQAPCNKFQKKEWKAADSKNQEGDVCGFSPTLELW